MARLNIQKEMVSKDGKLFWDFTKREWLQLFTWFGVGAIAAGSLRLASDHSFIDFLTSKYAPKGKIFDAPGLYVPYLIIPAVAVLLGIVITIPNFFGRGFRSWWAGVTSGLALLSFLSTFIPLALGPGSFQHRLFFAMGMVSVSFLFSFVLYLRANKRAQNTLPEDDLKVSPQIRSLVGTRLSETDDAIRSWEEDSLGRVALIESMSVKLMISKTPVLALFGEFGSGKTSILNLLRKHLKDKAVVISFSTWLPGSQETLIAYLLGDIANECQKQYVVPGLRKSAKQLAKALGQHVPLIRSYLELLPAPTQKEDIANLNAALARLPKRVVVLLDELDRMEKTELLILLKVIRGISSVPNLSFVCAGERRTIIEMVRDGFNDKSNTYFEKFFPASIPIPRVPPTVLKRVGTQRLVATFIRREWLQSESEVDGFRTQIDALWTERIAPFCSTLRAIGSLTNDVDAAALRLKHEVHPVDLTLIELLRRFKPDVYEIVGRNPEALTGGEGIMRGGSFLLEKEKNKLEEQLLADLKQAVPDPEQLKHVNGILGELFPNFRKIDPSSQPRPIMEEPQDKGSTRVSRPRIFPAYFQYELPESVFSSVEMDALLKRMSALANPDDVEQVFLETLDRMEKGSLKRDDFLSQLAEASLKFMPLQIGKVLVHATMRAAHKYTYDMLAAFGEAGHVLRIVIRISDRLPPPERLGLLENCILDATDDTMALNVLTRLTGPHDDFNLNVSLSQLYPTFLKRMRNRYGRDVDAANIDLSTSDPWAFNYWGHIPKDDGIAIDPEDREIQRDFWLRHIGDSRSRLAEDFRKFFLPAAVSYPDDPAPFVENKIPLADLKRLDHIIPDDPAMNEVERHALIAMRRLLRGEFNKGVGPDLYRNEDLDTT